MSIDSVLDRTELNVKDLEELPEKNHREMPMEDPLINLNQAEKDRIINNFDIENFKDKSLMPLVPLAYINLFPEIKDTKKDKLNSFFDAISIERRESKYENNLNFIAAAKISEYSNYSKVEEDFNQIKSNIELTYNIKNSRNNSFRYFRSFLPLKIYDPEMLNRMIPENPDSELIENTIKSLTSFYSEDISEFKMASSGGDVYQFGSQIYQLCSLASMRAIYPKEFDKHYKLLDKDFWGLVQGELNTLDKLSPEFILTVFYSRILLADEINFTANGLDLKMPDKGPQIISTPLPDRRNF